MTACSSSASPKECVPSSLCQVARNDFAHSLLSLPSAAQFKDHSVLCQLAQFDVFLVSADAANRHRAPKPYVFALKSRLPRAHFEDSAQWCHLVSTKTPDEAAGWVQTIIEAGVSFIKPP